MKTELYKKLRAKLPQASRTETAVEREMFDLVMTDEEAELAVELSADFMSIDEIAAKTERDRESLIKALDEMADKGIVYRQKNETGLKYKLMSPMWMMDLSLMNRKTSPRMEKIASLQPDYYLGGFGQVRYTQAVAVTRVVPLEEALPEGVEVYPWERISHLLDGADYWAATNCPCRRASGIREEKCDHIMEDTCVSFGKTAHYLVERGVAHALTRREIGDLQKKLAQDGLVFTANNVQEITWICNCCGCCCVNFWGLEKLNIPTAIAKANFLSHIVPEECIACGNCVDACPVKCITLDGDYAVVDETKCVGCGVCVVTCPSNAAHLKRTKEILVPPKTAADLDRLSKRS